MTPDTESLRDRVFRQFTVVFSQGLAAAVAGIVVLGLGGRLMMFLSRLAHPRAVGALTNGGNRVGEFTLDGTIGLVLFVGLLGGLMTGILWTVIRPWLPARHWMAGVAALGLGGFNAIADEVDFIILGDPAIDVVMLLALVLLFGITVSRLTGVLEGQLLPRSESKALRVSATLLVTAAAPIAGPTFLTYFSDEFCFCSHPPSITGAFLLATATATGFLMVTLVRGSEPRRWLTAMGRLATSSAITTGGVHLWQQVARILGF